MFNRDIPPISVRLFEPGKKIIHDGKTYTVESVYISGYRLTIKFEESTVLYDSDMIPCEPSVLNFNRK